MDFQMVRRQDREVGQEGLPSLRWVRRCPEEEASAELEGTAGKQPPPDPGDGRALPGRQEAWDRMECQP